MSKNLILKPINSLLEESFFIPDYQRGYRWTNTQVNQLLDDIWSFIKNPQQIENGKEEPFYCLQPIVVKKYNDNMWEVIDGQQRLTTIKIILTYFNARFTEEFRKKIYDLSYQTRPDSEAFLREINENEKDDNIDYFHIYNAYETVKEWFKDKQNFINDIESALLNKTKIIWYEAIEMESNNSIDIFTRINIGKILLTNAELIKALFLQKENFSDSQASLKQIQIASEWDLIEKTLQDDEFWFFIYNPNNPLKYDNRIEYIFDLMKERTKETEYYYTFNKFYKDFLENHENNKPDIDKIWLEIKKYYLTFEEWFKNYELFHYAGFLIDCGISINTIKEHSENREKDRFKAYLKDEIRNQVSCSLDDVRYGDKHIKKVLLLFNIQTILETQKSDARFPFHKYKSENWDIEHVHSQTEKTINGNQRQEWINDILEYFCGSSNLEKINTHMETIKDTKILEFCEKLVELKQKEKIENNEFDKLFKKVQEHFKEGIEIENKDNISNLALLDATTNRSYGNSFFPIKRKKIIENDRSGIFVPICTKNLFLKYYSSQFGELMYWNQNDANDYLIAINETLKDFLQDKEI